VVLLLFHSNLTHQGIMHIKEAVSLQQHLEIGFPDATVVVLKTAAGRLTLFLAKAGLSTARCMHDQGSRALAKRRQC
jgi:hypothetical protein